MTTPVYRPPASTPGFEQLGDAVLVRAAAVRALVFALSRAVDDRRRHGKPEQVAEFEAFRRIAVSALESGPMSQRRHSDVAMSPALGQSISDEGDWLSIADAAQLTGLSRRQLQRVARNFSQVNAARRIGLSWIVNRAALVAYVNDRATERDSAA